MNYRLFAITFLAPCALSLIALPGCAATADAKGGDHGGLALAVYAPSHATPVSRPIECDAVEATDGPAPADAADLLAHLDGVWRRCGGSDVSQPGPHDGVEIDETGRTFLLHADASGALERATGFANEYFVTPVQNGDQWYAYEIAGNTGMYPKGVAFSKSGSTFRWLHGTAPGDDVYVRTSAPVGGALTGHRAARLGAAACTLPEAGVHGSFHTREDLSASIVGKWVACGDSFFPGTNGFEFTADGRYFALHIDDAGAITRSTAPDEFGTIRYDDGVDMEGAPRWTFVLQTATGVFITPAAVAEAPVKLQLSNMGQGPYTYSALP